MNQATSDFESATAVIADRRHERLLENVQIVTQDALLKLNAHSAEVQAFVQSAVILWRNFAGDGQALREYHACGDEINGALRLMLEPSARISPSAGDRSGEIFFR